MQTSPVQQMMAENPTIWWNSTASVVGARPLLPPLPNSLHLGQPSSTTAPLLPNPTSSSMNHPCPPSSSLRLLQSAPWNNENQEFPDSWSQLLLGGFAGEEERVCYAKKIENWEDQIDLQIPSSSAVEMSDVKREHLDHGYALSPNQNVRDQQRYNKEDYHTAWPPINNHPNSCPNSCVTGYSSNTLDFSGGSQREKKNQRPEQCYSSATAGAALKKSRVLVATPGQTPFKVRKEKLGDRITALHQLVSPFGKTDTASVLLEAIGYIKFLQGQIAVLSSPYMGSASGNQKQPAKSEGRGCRFPEDPGQSLNESCLKRKATSEQKVENEPKKDLRSRGLCLVPLSATLHVGGNQNGSNFWSPSAIVGEISM